MAFEVKECPRCKELREKTTGFKKRARICRSCEEAKSATPKSED